MGTAGALADSIKICGHAAKVPANAAGYPQNPFLFQGDAGERPRLYGRLCPVGRSIENLTNTSFVERGEWYILAPRDVLKLSGQ